MHAAYSFRYAPKPNSTHESKHHTRNAYLRWKTGAANTANASLSETSCSETLKDWGNFESSTYLPRRKQANCNLRNQSRSQRPKFGPPPCDSESHTSDQPDGKRKKKEKKFPTHCWDPGLVHRPRSRHEEGSGRPLGTGTPYREFALGLCPTAGGNLSCRQSPPATRQRRDKHGRPSSFTANSALF
jgi:hypothetical protein